MRGFHADALERLREELGLGGSAACEALLVDGYRPGHARRDRGSGGEY